MKRKPTREQLETLDDCIRSMIENTNDVQYFADKRDWDLALDTLDLVDNYSQDVRHMLRKVTKPSIDERNDS